MDCLNSSVLVLLGSGFYHIGWWILNYLLQLYIQVVFTTYIDGFLLVSVLPKWYLLCASESFGFLIFCPPPP